MKKNKFTREQWSSLPKEMRRRWWRETDYGRLEPSAVLLREIATVLQRHLINDWRPGRTVAPLLASLQAFRATARDPDGLNQLAWGPNSKDPYKRDFWKPFY